MCQGRQSGWSCLRHCLEVRWGSAHPYIQHSHLILLFPGVVGWITQLVVAADMRKRYIATQLLQTLKENVLFQNVTAVGLVSSHPVACYVLAKYARKQLSTQAHCEATANLFTSINIKSIDTEFIRINAKNILKATTVEYLKTAELRGSLFEDNPKPGVISSADTQFFVDHTEPLVALKVFQDASVNC